MGLCSAKRWEKSSRASIWATVKRAVSRMTSARSNLSNHSLCQRTSVERFVHHLEELVHVGLGVGLHLLGGEHGAGLRLAAGVADAGRPVADDEHHLVAQLLELAQLAQPDDVAQGDVGRAGVEAQLQAQAAAGAERRRELVLGNDLRDGAAQEPAQVRFVGDRHAGHVWPFDMP